MASSVSTFRRRAIFLDVDGTLIDHEERLADSSVDAIRQARAAGHLVFICTGRARAEISDAVNGIGFDGVISAGGGFVEHEGRVLQSRTIPADGLHRILDFLDGAAIEYILQGFDAVFPSTGLTSRLQALAGDRDLGDWALMSGEARPDPDRIEPIAKATFFGEEPTTFARVRDGLGDEFHVLTGSMPFLGESGGEISPQGVNKGAAIAGLIPSLGIAMEDVIAIGDSSNDVEMLTLAGVGIAMGNADGSIKALADEVTGAVDADGVWQAFVRHGLAR